MTNKEFWMQVYISAIKAGNSAFKAVSIADDALVALINREKRMN
jgi:hypothetical protein